MESCEKKIKREKKKSRVGVRPFAISLPSRPIASASTICCLLNRRGRRTTYEQPLYKESARKGVDGREGGREVRPVTHELYRTSGQMSPPRTLVVPRL